MSKKLSEQSERDSTRFLIVPFEKNNNNKLRTVALVLFFNDRAFEGPEKNLIVFFF